MGMIKRVVIITIATALFTAPLTGCSKDDEGMSRLQPTNSSKSEGQQEDKNNGNSKDNSSKAEETALPGEDITVVIGESIVYKDEVTISLDRVHELGSEEDGTGYFGFVFTIQNNSDKHLDVSSISNFALYNKSVHLKDAFFSSRALITAIKSITDVPVLANTVPSNSTITGYIYAEAPLDYTEMRISYYPNKEESGDTTTFTFRKTDVTPVG